MALAVLFRTDGLVLVALPLLILLPAFVRRPWTTAQRGNLLRVALPLMLVVGWVAWYNQLRFGSPLTSGYPGQTFSTPLLLGLRGLLLDGGRGFFYFNPALLLALPGLFLLGRRDRPLAATLLLLPVLRLLLYARWWGWSGGICWGPRYLEPAAALLALPAAVALVAAFRRGARFAVLQRAGALTLCLIGAAVSLLAVLVPYWSWWDIHDDEPFVQPVPVGAAERSTWCLPGKHDLLFSLTGGQLGGNVRLLFHKVAEQPRDAHYALPPIVVIAAALTVAGLAVLLAIREARSGRLPASAVPSGAGA